MPSLTKRDLRKTRLLGATLGLSQASLPVIIASGIALAAIMPTIAPAAPQQSRVRADRTATPPTDASVRTRADALLAQMTPEEKAGQLSTWFYVSFVPAMAQAVEKGVAGGQAGSLLFVSDAATSNRLQKVAVEQSRLKIPLLLGFDVIHGLHTIMPVPLALASSFDPALVEQVEGASARESRASGIHWAFAPNVDIARDPRWGRIVEGSGEDPYLGSIMAGAHVRGFQGPYLGSPDHIIAGPKHFAGYGASLGGRDYDEVNLSDSDLWNVYLPPFKAAIDAGAGNIMSAYMPLNGVPAVANHWLLTDVLRKEWGFKGFVVSDANAVISLKTQNLTAGDKESAARVIGAGLDMEMVPPGAKPATRFLPQALTDGLVDQAAVDDAVRHVLEAKIRMGLFENPYVDEKRAAAVFADPASRRLARTAAERSSVLLRNEGGVLPLDRRTVKSIALIGPMADSERDMLGSWVFPQNTPSAISIRAGLQNAVGKSVRINYSEGVRLPKRINPSPFAALEPADKRPALDENAEIAHAVALARNADVAVLALGEGQDMSGEMASRSSLDLPGRQQALLEAVIATGKPVVVLLFGARPLDLKGAKPSAILDMWYPGAEGGTAASNLLFGDATPGGKLPITWISSIAHAPNTYAHLLSFDVPNTDKRYWNEKSSAPTYPFGHGLSYTTFAYSNLRVEQPVVAPGRPVTVAVDLRNTGPRAADEVAQLYIHQRYGTSTRPVRELKGFQRIALKAGETKTLRFTLTSDDLRYWSAVTKGWVADETKFDVWVGGDSAATLAGQFDVRKP